MHKWLAMFMITLLLGSFTGSAALAQVAPVPVPVAPPVIQVQPIWKAVPAVPGVVYAPTARNDIFRYQNNYYCWHDGRWFQGSNYGGPWNVIQNPPSVFTQIGPTYYKKRPPGWDRGRKAGWHGADMPPGQLKKQPPTVSPVVAPSGSWGVGQPIEQVAPGKGKKAKGGHPGKMRHAGGEEVVPVDTGGQGGHPGKGRGKFK